MTTAIRAIYKRPFVIMKTGAKSRFHTIQSAFKGEIACRKLQTSLDAVRLPPL